MSLEEVTNTQDTAPEPQQQEAAPPAPTPDAAPPTDQVAGADGTPATLANPYQPSFKYKVKDTEHEFDEVFKKLIKDKASEEKLRDLYTKGAGLEEVKKARDELKTKYDEIEPKYQNIDKSLSVLSQYVNKKDYDSFFQALRIPEQDILQYAANRLKYYQMPPEERQRLDTQKAESHRVQTLEQENQSLQTNMQRQQTLQRETELQFYSSQPDVAPQVQQYNALAGNPGAFRQKVIEKALAHYHLTGQDPTAQQAIQAALQELSPFLKLAPQAITPQAGQLGGAQNQPGQGSGNAQSNLPVIPNLQAAGGSPVKRQPRSIADLKELRRQRMKDPA